MVGDVCVLRMSRAFFIEFFHFHAMRNVSANPKNVPLRNVQQKNNNICCFAVAAACDTRVAFVFTALKIKSCFLPATAATAVGMLIVGSGTRGGGFLRDFFADCEEKENCRW